MAMRAGRDFEVLVSRIEEWLVPKGATVKSPDYIPDRDTGRLREVDASVRMMCGSVPVLITIECRDRSRKQDVRWIEEIAAKRDSIGASRTVAVSSSEWSQPAIQKAKRLRVEVRGVSEITEGDVVEWARNIKISLTTINWTIVHIGIRAAKQEGSPKLVLPTPLREALRRNLNDTPIGHVKPSGEVVTIRALLNEALRPGNATIDDIEVGQAPARKTVALYFKEGCFHIQTETGETEVRQMDVTLDVWLGQHVPSEPKVYRYERPSGKIVEVAESKLNLGDERDITIIYSTQHPMSFDPPSDRDRVP